MEYFKDYDNWNNLKQKIDSRKHKPPFFKEGQVWWVNIGVNIGTEIDGKGNNFTRPVLIIKKFSKYQFLALPLSTKIKENDYYEVLKVKGKRNSIIISQIRTLSYKRLENMLDELEISEFKRVLEIVFKKIAPSNFLKGSWLKS